MRANRAWLFFAILVLAIIFPVIARAQPPAPVRATLFTETVQWTTAPGTAVRVVLRNDQVVKATANATADAAGEVTATFPRIDDDADRVTGRAPANAEVIVTVNVSGGAPVSVPATTDAAGDYSASFAGLVDLEPGSTVFTAYTMDRITYRALGVVE